MDNSTLLKGRWLKAHFSSSLHDIKSPKWKTDKTKYKMRWQSEAGALYGGENDKLMKKLLLHALV